jgi:4-hydroxybenzoate polyprenyltransferase
MSLLDRGIAWSRLLRLSNAPTAVADVWMGYAVTLGALSPSSPLGLATLASLAAYHGGMALNDAVDADADIAEGRDRPIAQGTVSKRAAYGVAYGLICVSLVAAVALFALTRDSRIVGVHAALLLAVVAYNSPLKRQMVGPVLMGLCRTLNVLLGVFAVPPHELSSVFDYERGTIPAILLGLYVVGVTVFARDERRNAGRAHLLAGCSISALAIGLLAARDASDLLRCVAVAVAGLIALRGMVAGVLQATPRNIGRGVGIAIQGIVVIDAVLAGLYAGPVAGMAVLTLLPLTMIMARFVPQT